MVKHELQKMDGLQGATKKPPHGEHQFQSDGGCEQEDGIVVPTSGPGRPYSSPFTFLVEVDAMQCLLLLVSIATRMWRLDYPRGAVFDELHFGKSAAMYLKQTFHFDIHPPLGKMLIALAGHYAGYDGEFKADKIGADFGPETPVWHFRFFPAFLGSLVAPLVYQIVVELGLSRWTAALAGCLVILDNAFLVQCRFMLVEGMLLCFTALTIVAYLKFRKANHRNEFSVSWWISSIVMATAGALALSIRYLGAFTLVLVVFMSARDLWRLLPHPQMTNSRLLRHVLARLAVVCAIPVTVYVSVFYVHLSILTKAGPHDSVLTSAFQASLEGGLAAITRGQPLEIMYGSQVTLRHTYSAPCWLHSHNALYPVRYGDQRGSSHQQQVTCYQFKDVNNWWIVKDPHNASLVVDDPMRPVKDGDVIQLIHGMTGRALNSHDVAAPMSPLHQEVSGYIDHNVSFPAQNLWRLEIVNKERPGETWKTIQSHVRLHHVNTSQALKKSGKQLPDWGFHQLEVVTDRVTNHQATVWNVEEHRYSKSADEDKSKKDLAHAEMIPMKPTRMGFWSKFIELQIKMFTSQRDVQLEHQYSSDPLEWPLLDTNIAYWVRPQDYAQIQLLGNVVVWCSGAIGTVVYVGLLVFYLLRRRRGHRDIDQDLWSRFVLSGELFLAGYALHYVPHLLVERTLFLYLYLPALLYQILLTSAVIEHLYHLIRPPAARVAYLSLVTCWFLLVLYTFITFLPLSYGFTPLTGDQLDQLTWRHTWSFLRKLT